MGVFLAYFPTWLKFHELFRLGAYIHPFDFISSVYSNDLKASDQYLVRGDNWEAKFGDLKDFEDPFALLTPAMQEGSALGGPFLPLECTLSEVHHRMEDGKKSCYRLYAFPEHWQTELQAKSAYLTLRPGAPLATMTSVTVRLTKENILKKWRSISPEIDYRHGRVAYHIGIKLGTPTGKMHPGWTTHLPGKDGLLCERYGCHDLTKTQFGSTVTEPALQDDTPGKINSSRLQNLPPSQPLTSTRPQVRFGSPINLAEVDSADVVRWSSVDIMPNSFQARIFPGVPVEVHDPPVSKQPSQILPTTLKRRATNDLYHPGTPKKMKTAVNTHLNLEGLDANDTCKLMGHAHEEVLGVATMAGLLNPAHFEVGPSGTIGLTEFGSKMAASPETTKADPETFRNLETRKWALMATEIRYFMNQGGFWGDGHSSLALLRAILDEKYEVSSEDLLDYVLGVYKNVADPLADLLDTAQTLKSQRYEPMTEEIKTDIMRALSVLYSQHKGKGLSPVTRSKVANTHPGRPRLEMAQYLVGIAKNYLDMFVFSDASLKHTDPLPTKYAQQLARSLAQQKQLSTDIQSLLDAHGDES
ncbi:hypothetical protein CDV36_009910 [Fusarium kuroshium]|uniref:Uncharacterized protein n=1 Tax=Fusarium kuroshium TaxID=2010991 RepID=A0A3M2RZ21_9HYPO|nr:hypothetical protein CDV36_009910 [Fusarium kuroshium]